MAEDVSGSTESFRKITPVTISFRQVARIARWTDQPPWMIGFEESICSRRFPIIVAPNRQHAQLLCDALNDRYSNQLMLPRFGWLPESDFSSHTKINLDTSIQQAQVGKLHGKAAAALHSLSTEVEAVNKTVTDSLCPDVLTIDARQYGRFFVFVRMFPGLRTSSPWKDWVILPDQEVETTMLEDARKWSKENWGKIIKVIQKQSRLRITTPLHREKDELKAVEQLLTDVLVKQKTIQDCKQSTEPQERMGRSPTLNSADDDVFITKDDPDAHRYQDGGKWCDGKFAQERYGISSQRLSDARAPKEFKGIQVFWKKVAPKKGKTFYVPLRQNLEALSNAIDNAKDSDN